MSRVPVAKSPSTQGTAQEVRLRELDRKTESVLGSFQDLHPFMTPPVFSAYLLGSISVPTNAWTTIPMDTVAVDSDNGFGSNGYVVQREGIYAISGTCPIGGVTAGKRATALAINGVRITGGDPNYGDSPDAPRKVIALNEDDVITLQFAQNSGTVWTTQGGGVNCPAIDINWLRPLLAPPVPHQTVVTPPGKRPYFTAADWMWDPIPANPVLAGNSQAIANNLANGQQVVDSGEYGVRIIDASQITGGTPRYTIPLTAGYGSVSQLTNVPIPDGTTTATGGDKGLGVWDPSTGLITSLWVAQPSGGGWTAQAGSQLAVTSDGRETGGDTSTGSNLARFGCVVRRAEIAAGDIPHALFFATNIATPHTFVYPATKTDGTNDSGRSPTIPEGTRVQLDPSINVAAIPGITALEVTVGVALQRYGAYCGDNGGAAMAFSFELGDYSQWGASGDYFNMSRIPWSRLQILNSWNGT